MPPAAMETNKPEAAEKGDEGNKSKEEESGSAGTVSLVEKKQISNVIVHPLVLLSVVDHFNRMGKVGHHK